MLEYKIVESNYCYYDLHSGCVKGLEEPDSNICDQCKADAVNEITRITLNG